LRLGLSIVPCDADPNSILNFHPSIGVDYSASLDEFG
jgi:hypothetical protein